MVKISWNHECEKNTVKISSECMAFTVSNVCISTWRQLRARLSSWHSIIYIIFSVKTSTFPEIWRRFAKHARPYFSFINYADIKFTNKSLVIFMVSIDGLFFQLYSNLSIHCGMNSRQIVTETIFCTKYMTIIILNHPLWSILL